MSFSTTIQNIQKSKKLKDNQHTVTTLRKKERKKIIYLKKQERKTDLTRKRAPARCHFPHYWQATTRWDDNNVYGHLNNTVHYRLFDTAVNSFLLDHNFLDFHTGRSFYLVVETGCSYFAELLTQIG